MTYSMLQQPARVSDLSRASVVDVKIITEQTIGEDAKTAHLTAEAIEPTPK
jgi:hypothetical protein